jgi:hypothetical protein
VPLDNSVHNKIGDNMQVELYDEDGSSEFVELPTKFEVCPRCEGKGVHDCWAGGMTGDEMAEQGPEFYEDYMSGVYDRQCTECNGDRVVRVVARERVSTTLLKRYDRHMQELDSLRAMEESERRMGC